MSILLPIQIILTIFLFFAASRVYLRFKEGSISLGPFLFWIGIWFLALFSIFNPDFITYFAKFLGIGRGADAIIYISLVLLFYLVFRLSVMLENLEEKMSELIRKIALKERETSKKS